jgi:hypothetical protein
MDLLDYITIKNKFEILILSNDKKGLNGKRKENYETLLDVLKTLNNAMLHFENLNKELRNQRNRRFKNRIKTRILIAYFTLLTISFIAVLITGILIGKEMYE